MRHRYDFSKLRLVVWQLGWRNGKYDGRWMGKYMVDARVGVAEGLRDSRTFGPFKERISVLRLARWWMKQKKEGCS